MLGLGAASVDPMLERAGAEANLRTFDHIVDTYLDAYRCILER